MSLWARILGGVGGLVITCAALASLSDGQKAVGFAVGIALAAPAAIQAATRNRRRG